MTAKYFDEDFSWEEHARVIESSPSILLELPPVLETSIDSFLSASLNSTDAIVDESGGALSVQDAKWNNFYDHHEEGMIYKPRRYLLPEFSEFWNNPNLNVIVEVGCGYGCTCFPIMKVFHGHKYIATDCSDKALQIFSNKLTTSEKSYESKVHTMLWDITEPPSSLLLEECKGAKLLLSIFALSAVAPVHHKACMVHFARLLHTDSEQAAFILFRDYGLYDMTMFRHRVRFDDRLFARQDRTLCYYFSLEYLRSVVEEAGLRVVELKYATVINRNRKTNEEMHRVFVHGVFAKCSSEEERR